MANIDFLLWMPPIAATKMARCAMSTSVVGHAIGAWDDPGRRALAPRLIEMMVANALTVEDIELHARLRIPRTLLEAAQVRRLDDFEARVVLGVNGKVGDFAGIQYAYFDPETGRPVTSRIRLDHPPLKADGSPDGKYRSPYGDNRHLYFPPGCAAMLKDLATPVIFVEAEKSALAISAAAERSGCPMLRDWDRRVLGLAGKDRQDRGRFGRSRGREGRSGRL